jgi:periplasmic divalent cation tolerance protein
MPATTQFRVLFVTVPDAKLADDIAAGLVERKLAACVNIIPGVTSVYRWEEALHRDSEILLTIKTRAGAINEVTQFIKEKHPAEVPEIISLPITEGSSSYLEWLGANTIFSRAEDTRFPY